MSGASHGLGDTSGYDIRIKGHVGDHLATWFEGIDLAFEPDSTTVLHCPALDQAALHGLLRMIRDLGFALISVTGTASDGDVATDARSTTDN